MKKTNFNNHANPSLSASTLNNIQKDIEEAINGVSSVIELTETILANKNYTIPLNYHVGTNELVIFYLR